jgi:hypothetical protein
LLDVLGCPNCGIAKRGLGVHQACAWEEFGVCLDDAAVHSVSFGILTKSNFPKSAFFNPVSAAAARHVVTDTIGIIGISASQASQKNEHYLRHGSHFVFRRNGGFHLVRWGYGVEVRGRCLESRRWLRPSKRL